MVWASERGEHGEAARELIFKKEAKWRPWVKGLSEVMERAVGRSEPKGNDEKLHKWLHASKNTW